MTSSRTLRVFFLAFLGFAELGLVGCPEGFQLSGSGPGGSIRANAGPGGANVSVQAPGASFDLDAGKGGARIALRTPEGSFVGTGGPGGGSVQVQGYQAKAVYPAPAPVVTQVGSAFPGSPDPSSQVLAGDTIEPSFDGLIGP